MRCRNCRHHMGPHRGEHMGVTSRNSHACVNKLCSLCVRSQEFNSRGITTQATPGALHGQRLGGLWPLTFLCYVCGMGCFLCPGVSYAPASTVGKSCVLLVFCVVLTNSWTMTAAGVIRRRHSPYSGIKWLRVKPWVFSIGRCAPRCTTASA